MTSLYEERKMGLVIYRKKKQNRTEQEPLSFPGSFDLPSHGSGRKRVEETSSLVLCDPASVAFVVWRMLREYMCQQMRTKGFRFFHSFLSWYYN
jgi:hypothetical protein